MKLLKFIPLQLTFALVLGIITGYFLILSTFSISIVLVFLLILTTASYLFEKRKLSPSFSYPIISLLLFYVIGLATITFQNDLNKKNHYTDSSFEKDSLQTIVLRINTQLRSSLFHNKFEAEVPQINNQKTQGKILLNISKDSVLHGLPIGNEITVRARFEQVNTPKNPYQFNYKKYLEKKGVYRQITLPNHSFLLLDSKPTSLNYLADQFRKRVNKSLEKTAFKDDELGIINALLLGQRQEVSKELVESYTKAGAIHILAISGLHVGIILWILSLILKPLEYLNNGKNIKLIIAIILLWSFAFVAGLSPSVVRAVTMFTAVAISFFGKRKSNIYHNLVISIFFLLLINPMYLFEVGFQLSYLAVFFIVWLQPIISNLWRPRFKLINYFWNIFSVSLAAQIGVLPLSLYYFHQFPGLFFITNLAVLPLLGFILGLGLLIIFLSLINLLPEFIAISFQKLINLMNQFITWVSDQESFLFENISFSILLVIASYLLIIFFFRWMEKKSYVRLKYALLSVLLIQLVFIYEKRGSSLEKELIIFNKSRGSVLGNRDGNGLTLYHTLDSLNIHENLVKSYLTGSNIKSVSVENSIDKNILFNNGLLLLDSLGMYKLRSFKPKRILLTQSPKINLERLIDILHPKEIIADNSNYKSFVKRWKQTCVKHKIKFHYTNEHGAYRLNK